MELNPETIRRLAFIKYFFQFAREQSKYPSPQNYISILMFHDSVELFLHLSAESLGANLIASNHKLSLATSNALLSKSFP